MEIFHDRGVLIRICSRKSIDPDLVCPERLDPDQVNIRPVPKPWLRSNLNLITKHLPLPPSTQFSCYALRLFWIGARALMLGKTFIILQCIDYYSPTLA